MNPQNPYAPPATAPKPADPFEALCVQYPALAHEIRAVAATGTQRSLPPPSKVVGTAVFWGCIVIALGVIYLLSR